MWVHKQTGFTIVELLIVIVVIAILAALAIVGYNGAQNRANESVLKSELASAVKSIELTRAQTGAYPAQLSALAYNADAIQNGQVTFQYRADTSTANQTFCLTGVFKSKAMKVSNDSPAASAGACTGHYNSPIATVSNTVVGTFDTPEGTPASMPITYSLEPSDLVLVIFSADFYSYVDSITAGSTSFQKFYEKNMGADGYQKIIGFRGTGMTGAQTASIATHWQASPSTQRTYGEYIIYVVKDRGAASITTTDTSFGAQAANSVVAPAIQTLTKGQLAIFNHVLYNNTFPTYQNTSTAGFNWTTNASKSSPSQAPKISSMHVVAPSDGSVQYSMTMPSSGAIYAGASMFVIR